ncbi:MAG: hypothetical protein OHK0017_07700 [Patescibacteria group bacterium]
MNERITDLVSDPVSKETTWQLENLRNLYSSFTSMITNKPFIQVANLLVELTKNGAYVCVMVEDQALLDYMIDWQSKNQVTKLIEFISPSAAVLMPTNTYIKIEVSIQAKQLDGKNEVYTSGVNFIPVRSRANNN